MKTDEFGKKCQSCQKVGKPAFAHMFYHPVRGLKGKSKDRKKYRRLCKDCWKLADAKEI